MDTVQYVSTHDYHNFYPYWNRMQHDLFHVTGIHKYWLFSTYRSFSAPTLATILPNSGWYLKNHFRNKYWNCFPRHSVMIHKLAPKLKGTSNNFEWFYGGCKHFTLHRIEIKDQSLTDSHGSRWYRFSAVHLSNRPPEHEWCEQRRRTEEK